VKRTTGIITPVRVNEVLSVCIRVQPNILKHMWAIATVSAINIMVIRGLNIILLMSTGVIAAEVYIFAPVSTLFRQPDSTLGWVKE
jgi:hypothetical protein